MRILIIEDDKNLCQIMRAGLQDAGIDSDFCHDGETGLELLLHNCYDACCLDRMLPSIDGLTILKKARAAKVSAPVLMLTAMGGLDDKVDGLEAGADDYLAKPFAMRELVARLHALLRRPSQAMAVEESNQMDEEAMEMFQQALTEYGELDANSRPTLPKLRFGTATTQIVAAFDRVLGQVMEEGSSLELIHKHVYCAATAVIQLNG